MMWYVYNVQTFSTLGKSAKGQALQEVAMRFQDVLIQGDAAPIKILLALRETAASIDGTFPRGRRTHIDFSFDENNGSGQISATPASDDVTVVPYFRIHFHRVARTATIDEAVRLTKGGAK